MHEEASEMADIFLSVFGDFDYIVSPSSSCIGAVKYRYATLEGGERFDSLSRKSYELCEFLHDIVGVENLDFQTPFTRRTGLHDSCHAVRELYLSSPSELNIPRYSKVEAVLSRVPGIEIVRPQRDECCGFGGGFSVMEPDISVMMGRDRIDDHSSKGVEVITGVDASCLMHMEAIARREKRNISFLHIANILAGREKGDIRL
jgi:L-lactate dehydrogenase complex protein LldE